ncbi:ribose-5-phosphate isomerase RpiA [Chitinasiproducens palmae]|uniref:Ribose-5-phosphate isomerase A n=1 Tax=Chitinasiproducens palmae TaxID=1770053 RepID=A0A1H2PM45_9BURK|nr:ribose-5-phosphate isomerase RpiA [Chitinasiproducens palmae]SDV47603.1 ribose-5-phosphate isomerase [Chitinasiproducens palmae]
MTQDELKVLVGRAAAEHVLAHLPSDAVLGVGTGSTANCFIDALAPHRARIRATVSSSTATTTRLEAAGFTVIDLNDVESLPIYVDGADEIDADGHMIKGGGGALTREKIVASVAGQFVCIADGSKRVERLGTFPLPVEVVPLARNAVARRLRECGGAPTRRLHKDGSVYVTDNGNEILDVAGLDIVDPRGFEARVNDWPGVVTVGLFARRRADLGLFAVADGVQTVTFPRQ